MVHSGELVFVFTINPITGASNFTEILPLDHPIAGATGIADTIEIVFNTEIVDELGEVTTLNVIVPIPDDGPTAMAGAPTEVFEGQNALLVGTNLLQNDIAGADGVRVSRIDYAGGSSDIPSGGLVTVTTSLGGVLTVGSDGSWSYQAPATVPDTSDDSFIYTIVDGDGDTSSASQSLTVNNLAIGDIIVPDNLTSGGVPIIIEQVSLTQIQGVLQTTGDVVFNFQIDPLTDVFTFTSELPFDNPGGGETQNIVFTIAGPDGEPVNITVQLVEGGGNSVSGSVLGDITVTVQDSTPTANAGPPIVLNEGDTATVIGANLLANDNFGTDLPGGGVVSITYNGGSTDIASGGSVTVTTALGGVLTVGSDGSWSYDAPVNITDTSDDSFIYTIADFDGDTSSASQAITINEDTLAVAGDNTLDTLGEANLAQGSSPSAPVTVTDQVTIDFGADTGTVAITQITAPVVSDPDGVAPGALTSLGRGLSFAETDLGGGARQLTATEDVGGTVVFTLSIDASGNYTFTLSQPLDHPDAGDAGAETGAADALDLAFTYTAAEDIDSDSGTITIRITDDGPTAVAGDDVVLDESNTVAGDGDLVTGTNLLLNDTAGADGARVSHIDYNGGR